MDPVLRDDGTEDSGVVPYPKGSGPDGYPFLRVQHRKFPHLVVEKRLQGYVNDDSTFDPQEADPLSPPSLFVSLGPTEIGNTETGFSERR